MAKITSGIAVIVKFIIAMSILGGGYYYISNYHKEDLNQFYLKFDSWGITNVGRAEVERKAAIDALSDRPEHVPQAQRDALKNRTIFLGADEEMVTLALGKPPKPPETNSQGQQVWIYYFDDYSRPTNLYFEKRNKYWVLVKAEKGNN